MWRFCWVNGKGSGQPVWINLFLLIKLAGNSIQFHGGLHFVHCCNALAYIHLLNKCAKTQSSDGFSSSHSRPIGSTTLLLPVVDQVLSPTHLLPRRAFHFWKLPKQSDYSAALCWSPLRMAVELKVERGP